MFKYNMENSTALDNMSSYKIPNFCFVLRITNSYWVVISDVTFYSNALNAF